MLLNVVTLRRVMPSLLRNGDNHAQSASLGATRLLMLLNVVNVSSLDPLC